MKTTPNNRSLKTAYSLCCIALILLIPAMFTSCRLFGSSDGGTSYTGPTTMIDDFEDGKLDIIVQGGRRGHWVEFLFPHPVDTLEPDSDISISIESHASMPPTHSAEGMNMTSTKALHMQGSIGNPSGALVGYVKLVTDLATNENWTSSSDYYMSYRYLLFYVRSVEDCTLWLSLPEKADGSSLAKGSHINITTDWSLISVDLDNCYLSYEPGTTVVISKAVQLVFYLDSDLDLHNVAEGESKTFDIWIDDIRFSDTP